MPSDIFNRILNRKLDTFKSVFLEDSESLYKTGGKLFHAQEFGAYRERVVAEIIRAILPGEMDVKDGFIITSKNKISTQCDLVIYDKNNTPILNDGVLRFFPVESVYGIGEVKSVIRSKSELTEILIKLSEQKKLDDDVIVKAPGEGLITFLVCKKIDFDFATNFNEIYSGVENNLRHNFILSLEDGLITYSIKREFLSDRNKILYDTVFVDQNPLYQYPVLSGDLLPSVISKVTQDDEYIHIKMFLHSISSTLNQVRKPKIELQNYYLL